VNYLRSEVSVPELEEKWKDAVYDHITKRARSALNFVNEILLRCDKRMIAM
jgi:16S rRNA G527 N7-methylase RsmG